MTELKVKLRTLVY